MCLKLQQLIDEERGFLDRKHGQDPGWSGPITQAYLKGYGENPRAKEHMEQRVYHESHCEHGWY